MIYSHQTEFKDIISLADRLREQSTSKLGEGNPNLCKPYPLRVLHLSNLAFYVYVASTSTIRSRRNMHQLGASDVINAARIRSRDFLSPLPLSLTLSTSFASQILRPSQVADTSKNAE
jgi:hypothetical protein